MARVITLPDGSQVLVEGDRIVPLQPTDVVSQLASRGPVVPADNPPPMLPLHGKQLPNIPDVSMAPPPPVPGDGNAQPVVPDPNAVTGMMQDSGRSPVVPNPDAEPLPPLDGSTLPSGVTLGQPTVDGRTPEGGFDFGNENIELPEDIGLETDPLSARENLMAEQQRNVRQAQMGLDESAMELERLNQEYMKDYNTKMTDYQDTVNKIANFEIDPTAWWTGGKRSVEDLTTQEYNEARKTVLERERKYFKEFKEGKGFTDAELNKAIIEETGGPDKRSIWGKIGLALAAGLTGAAGGYRGDPAAGVKFVQRLMDQSIEAQQVELGKMKTEAAAKQNALGLLRQKYGDDVQAELALRTNMLEGAKLKATELQSRLTNEGQIEALEMQKAQMTQKQKEHADAMAMRQRELGLQRRRMELDAGLTKRGQDINFMLGMMKDANSKMPRGSEIKDKELADFTDAMSGIDLFSQMYQKHKRTTPGASALGTYVPFVETAGKDLNNFKETVVMPYTRSLQGAGILSDKDVALILRTLPTNMDNEALGRRKINNALSILKTKTDAKIQSFRIAGKDKETLDRIEDALNLKYKAFNQLVGNVK